MVEFPFFSFTFQFSYAANVQRLHITFSYMHFPNFTLLLLTLYFLLSYVFCFFSKSFYRAFCKTFILLSFNNLIGAPIFFVFVFIYTFEITTTIFKVKTWKLSVNIKKRKTSLYSHCSCFFS